MVFSAPLLSTRWVSTSGWPRSAMRVAQARCGALDPVTPTTSRCLDMSFTVRLHDRAGLEIGRLGAERVELLAGLEVLARHRPLGGLGPALWPESQLVAVPGLVGG